MAPGGVSCSPGSGPCWTDPCDPAKGTLPSAQTSTVDGLVAAMTRVAEFRATVPAPVAVDGFNGQMIELRAAPSSKGCSNPALWTTPQGVAFDAYPLIVNSKATEYPAQFRILDVNGKLLVIRTTDSPGTSPNEAAQGVAPNPTRHAADQVELHQILNSIRIDATRQP